jgi:hypothetical protein
VKSGRRRQKGRHGSVLTFKVNYSPSPGGNYQRQDVPIESFYEPFFSPDNLPTSDSRFFRVALKLDLRGDAQLPQAAGPHAKRARAPAAAAREQHGAEPPSRIPRL